MILFNPKAFCIALGLALIIGLGAHLAALRGPTAESHNPSDNRSKGLPDPAKHQISAAIQLNRE